jgi:hypothetical protein
MATMTATAIDTTSDLDTTPDRLFVATDDGDVPALTTAELSVLFGMTPRRLRRLFRAAGVGCGQGSIYATTPDDAQAVLDRINTASA